ncbi:hypothetical protein [Caenispirillum bisanense]|uniref:Uncharacterized protein n=1 Tax=Caenispirillum bisanense TaxID=414052 RepID=A0A286GI84_9PROT|nr:hypothetical protein [Caenispirillum bisanense]SOD94829.1 hypothetical protein SAMN05421508_104135 [Caenispirillum bisanense]
MTLHRSLALATSLAALTAVAAPAVADELNHSALGTTAINVTALDAGSQVVVMRHADTAGSAGGETTAMILTRGGPQGTGGGYATEVDRTDQWEPGALKAEGGDYYTIRPQSPQGGGDPGATRVVRSDTWQPGYLKTEQGDYYMLAPDRRGTDADTEVTVVVDPAWSSAMQTYTVVSGETEGGAETFVQHSDQWQAGFVKDDQQYMRIVHLRDSAPAELLPDF